MTRNGITGRHTGSSRREKRPKGGGVSLFESPEGPFRRGDRVSRRSPDLQSLKRFIEAVVGLIVVAVVWNFSGIQAIWFILLMYPFPFGSRGGIRPSFSSLSCSSYIWCTFRRGVIAFMATAS